MTQTTPHKPTYAIIHGMAEGPFLSRHIRHALEQLGFQPTKLEQADIIITHSAGCFIVPASHQAKLLVHINPAYWPGKHLLRSLREKIAYDYRLRKQRKQRTWWFMSLAANVVYLGNLVHGWRLRKPYFNATASLAQLPPGFHAFIRNHADSYCEPEALLQATGSQYTYMTLPGHHDDCWRDPEAYVGIVQSLYARILAETSR